MGPTEQQNHNRRQAALALMRQYDGTAEELNRYNVAKQEVKEAKYRENELVYPFSKDASILQKAFTTMEQSNQPKAVRDQVEGLLTGMKISTNNPYYTQFTNIKMQAQRNHPDNFQGAVTFISSEILNNVLVTQETHGTKQY